MNDAYYAVVIGINRYPGISDLRHARGDAEAFWEWLVHPDGGAVPKDNTILITASDDEAERFQHDHLSARPTRSEFEKAIHRFERNLAARFKEDPFVRERSRLYLYGSGHGLTPAGSTAALLMADVGPGFHGENFDVSSHMRRFERCGLFKEVVVFVDCCRNSDLLASPSGTSLDDCYQPEGAILKLQGFAAPLGESAHEPPEPDDRRGYFTQALLDGLKGDAAVSGQVDSRSLGDYMIRRVTELAKAGGYEQHAKVEGDSPPIVFRTGVTAPEWNVTIRLPVGYEGLARLQDGFGGPIADFHSSEGSWQGRLKKGLYQVVPAAPGDPSFPRNGVFEVSHEDVHVEF